MQTHNKCQSTTNKVDRLTDRKNQRDREETSMYNVIILIIKKLIIISI